MTPVLPPQKGVFQLSNEDYFIEPLDGAPARPGHAQPHMVYKRQAPERQGNAQALSTCGVQGVFLPAAPWEGRPFFGFFFFGGGAGGTIA